MLCFRQEHKLHRHTHSNFIKNTGTISVCICVYVYMCIHMYDSKQKKSQKTVEDIGHL